MGHRAHIRKEHAKGGNEWDKQKIKDIYKST